jgi:hypothetical protein
VAAGAEPLFLLMPFGVRNLLASAALLLTVCWQIRTTTMLMLDADRFRRKSPWYANSL